MEEWWVGEWTCIWKGSEWVDGGMGGWMSGWLGEWVDGRVVGG